MARYRSALPQLGGDLFLTDGGLETTLIFHEGRELPDFAAFHLLRDAEGTAALVRCLRAYGQVARRHGAGLIPESATGQARADWGRRLGHSAGELDTASASRKSHAELSECTELDVGDPEEMGEHHRHVDGIAAACTPLFRPTSGGAGPAGEGRL